MNNIVFFTQLGPTAWTKKATILGLAFIMLKKQAEGMTNFESGIVCICSLPSSEAPETRYIVWKRQLLGSRLIHILFCHQYNQTYSSVYSHNGREI